MGCEEREILNNPDEWWQRVHEDDLASLMNDIEDHLEGRAPQFSGEYRMRHKDGTIRWMLSRGLAVRNEEGRAIRMAGSQTDITDRKTAEEQLRHRAFHDPVTSLPNRILFLDRLENAIRRSSRTESQGFDVVLIGVDRFKLVNETYGHATGDRILAEVAARLSETVHPGDTVARHGGDQFALLLEGATGRDSTIEVVGLLHKALGEPIEVEGEELLLSFSSGIVLGQGQYVRAQDVLRDADVAFARAKAQGKNRWEVFDSDMRDHSVAQLHLETDLRRAIERGELMLFYQPLVYLEDGRLAGFEALVRWRHPTRGLVSPIQFIPLAEETGLIVPLGRWVLSHGMHQLRDWHRRYSFRADLTMSLNVSGLQFQETGFVQMVEECLAEALVDPSTVKLEITETVLMENKKEVMPALNAIRAMGIDFYIDDFGTGYSSLGVLQDLPIAALKIDRSFVEKLRSSDAENSLVHSILNLASKRQLRTIAEGVETLEQLSALRGLGCELGQGYLFSEPVPAERAESLIQSGHPV